MYEIWYNMSYMQSYNVNKLLFLLLTLEQPLLVFVLIYNHRSDYKKIKFYFKACNILFQSISSIDEFSFEY